MTPESAPSSEQGPEPEEDALAQAEFAALHGQALRASGVPERYWGRLLHKLEHEVRAGATRGEQGAGPAGPGCRAVPGHLGGGPLWTLYQESVVCGRALARELRGGRPGSTWGRQGGLLGTACRRGWEAVPHSLCESAFSPRLCPAGQASVRPTDVCPPQSWGSLGGSGGRSRRGLMMKSQESCGDRRRLCLLGNEEPSKVWDPTVAARGLYLWLGSCRRPWGWARAALEPGATMNLGSCCVPGLCRVPHSCEE